jgi:hypothetical protein
VKTVLVAPGTGLDARRRLFDALEAAFGVRFSAQGPADALLALGEDCVPPAAELVARGLPALAVGSIAHHSEERVVVGDHAAVDPRLRGLVLIDQPSGPELAPTAGETVLAASEAGPAWTTTGGPVRVDRVRGSLPALGNADVLRQCLRVPGSLALLALVQLLRALDDDWKAPALRAAFVFDDPNLRRPTYGHIDYEALVAHADVHGHHAAMAMIPLDVARPDARAVGTFRRRPDRLSLVIHGNDHTRNELLQPRTRHEALKLGAHALARIERFERTTGVPVDRVMMPPHGRCAAVVANALAGLGFDGVCAIHPCPWTAETPPDHLLAGWSPCEFVEGSAVLPRFPLTVWASEIALRAFLDQPLVLYGHHDDLAGGLEPLAEAAARVNRLGDVQWTSVGGLARKSFAASLKDDVLHVRPWAQRIEVPVPAGVRRIAVHEPKPGTGLHRWTTGSGGLHELGEPVTVGPGNRVTVQLRPREQVDPASVPLPRARPWPVMRRRATEARDRLAPLRI